MAGFDIARLERVATAIERDIQLGVYFGAAIVVSRGKEIALSESFGHYDTEHDRAISLDSVFPIMSISKSLTAVVILADVERGTFQLTTRISEIIPEFGANGKSAVTVAQLLSHTSGLGDETPPGHGFTDPDALLAHVCKAPLRTAPGCFGYSGEAGYFVLAEFLRRCDKKRRSFSEIVTDDLLRPLAMNNTFIATTPDVSARRVPISVVKEIDGVYSADQIRALEKSFAAGLVEPGGSAVGTVEDIQRFALMLLEGGCLDGIRVLSPRMVGLATRIHTGDDEFGILQYGRRLVGWPALRANYGLGFQMRGPVAFETSPQGMLASPGTFGHKGAGLACFWADPETGVVFVCLTAGFLEESRSVQRWQRLSDLVHSAIVD